MEAEIRKKMYIKVYYSLLDWEWYSEPNTFRVFMHLLLTANRKDHPYQGDVIRRGEVMASREYLAKSTGLSIQNVRTAIKNLKSTGEITQRKIGKTNVFTIVSFSKWQGDNQIFNHESTANQPRNNQNVTTSQPQANHELTTLRYCKNEENEIMKECVEEKHPHGKLNNVFITESEYEQFKAEYPLSAENIIDELSVKIATGDSRYQKGHLGHLYIFARNYTPEKYEREEKKPSYDFELAMRRSLMIDPTKTKRGQ